MFTPRFFSSATTTRGKNRSLSSVVQDVNAMFESNSDQDYQWGTTIGNENIRANLEHARNHAKNLKKRQEELLKIPFQDPRGQSIKEDLKQELCYTGGVSIPTTSKLRIVRPGEDSPSGIWPAFRMMDETGRFLSSSKKTNSTQGMIPNDDLPKLRTHLMIQNPNLGDELSQSLLLQPSKFDFTDVGNKNTLMRAHRQIVRLRKMDEIFNNCQRQGRISFYVTCTGEEAIHIGAASALELGDVVLAQYREAGLLMWRGFTLDQFANQCFSNDLDLGKGRQMPVHYGSRALNYQTISSPLGTQLPHAVGVAYRLKMQGKPNVSIVFFGDGCGSTVDFHSACNFAATLQTPTIFFCRNNGFAISTPTEEQYAGDGIVCRAPGYGMAGIRVDGNDIFAVHAAVRQAKEYALEHSAPVMIEAMTYRGSHHSTSDDSTRYRNGETLEQVHAVADPLIRLEAFLSGIGWLNDDEEEESKAIANEEKLAVLKAIEAAEKRPKPHLATLFEDVYHGIPPNLEEQRNELLRHLERQQET